MKHAAVFGATTFLLAPLACAAVESTFSAAPAAIRDRLVMTSARFAASPIRDESPFGRPLDSACAPDFDRVPAIQPERATTPAVLRGACLAGASPQVPLQDPMPSSRASGAP
jgi:hypothetical protein